MSSSFLLLECHKCKDVRQINWPFFNVLKLYCDCCNKCHEYFKLSTHTKTQEELMEVPPREIVRNEADIPHQLSYLEGNRKTYFSYRYMPQDNFGWYRLDEKHLKFPVLLLNYQMNIRDRRLTCLSTGVVPLMELENFLNEPDFAWWSS